MLLTAELDRLSATDWQPFFAQERAKPYFAELDAFVTAAAAERTVYPARRISSRRFAPARLRRCGRSFWGRTPIMSRGRPWG